MSDILILDKHEFLNKSWIGAGMIKDPKSGQKLGFVMKDPNDKTVIAADLSFENALILAGCLIKAAHAYLELKDQKIK